MNTSQLGADRQHAILSLIDQGQKAGVVELAQRFSVSQQTIRRDIKTLEDAGHVRRVHGGAVSMRTIDLTARRPVTERLDVNRKDKILAAQAALALFEDDMSVYIGASSTMLILAELLVEVGPRLNVVTSMIDVATQMAAVPRFHVTLVGGEVNSRTRSIIGPEVRQALESRVFDLAISGVSAISAVHGLLGHSVQQVSHDALLRNQSHRVAYVADVSKFGQSDAHVIGSFIGTSAIATNQIPPDEFVKLIDEADVQLLLPE